MGIRYRVWGQNKVANAYNTALRHFGDHNPDFLKAVNDLTYQACLERNKEVLDGPNDGLVGENSFPWGAQYEYLIPRFNRGISHGDMIDLNRENFDGFDVREFYVQLVDRLRQKGF